MEVTLVHPIITGFWFAVGATLWGFISIIPALILVGFIKFLTK